MAISEEYAQYLSLGSEIAASLLIPIGLGYGVDFFFATSPFGVLIGAVVGIVIFFLIIMRISKRFENSKKIDDLG